MGQRQSQQVQPSPPQNQSKMNPPRILVLSKEEAREALAKADTLDEFRSTLFLDSVNTLARAGLDYSPMDGPDLNIEIPGLRQTIYVCWMSPSAEAGMPHTRAPNIVCMPLYWQQGSIMNTLKHEIIHIDQRERPEKWVRWAVSQGWTRVEENEIPERWLRVCRLNPDTMAYRFWAYKGRWIPLPMYERADKPKLREIRVRWYDRKTGELLVNPPSEVLELIDGIQNPEHPFEIAAYKGIQI